MEQEILYRPPFEAESFLLQVTRGCSHNKCSFCTMYRDFPFRVESMADIEEQLEYAARFYPKIKRVFLENGDPFVLSADMLSKIAERIHKNLPEVKTIAMYASINNIKTKTDEELKKLRALGINELNIGLESGLDEALEIMNKGYTGEEALTQLMRLKDANIDYGANVIFGAAGSGKGIENAEATAEIVNKTEPYLIFTGTIHADKGCPLYDDMKTGKFVENTVGEYLEEEEHFLELLDLTSSRYFALHPSNIVPMQGILPDDKGMLIALIRQKRDQLSYQQRNSRPIRFNEGAVFIG